jgi:protein tyrosine phosphatase
VNKVVQTRVGKTRPGIKSKRTVSSKDEVPGSDIVKKPKIDFDKLFLQYWQLTSSVEDEFKPYLPYTEQSCRCSWIFCPSKTNVNVTSFPKEEYGYIHANTVSLGKGLNFIATIYPYQRTMFWSMVLEHGNSILDVTNENDLERNSVTPYYPQAERQRYVYGKRMEVTCLKKEEVTPVLIKYQLKVKDLERNEVKLIDRFHYIGWEDVCGTNEVELFDVVKNLESYLGQQSVPLVHCMGGVGRTGTALTAFALKALIDTGDIADEESLLGHIQRIILEGRKQRGPEYVQTSTQVETLYKFGLLAFDHKKEQEKKELNKLVEFNC